MPSNDSYHEGYDTVDWTTLNGLVATAYAWYWSKTGDSAALSRGDMVFQHMLDLSGDPSWSGKMYSQMYQWTFDYARLRSAPNAVLTILPSQNPYTGPYADTEPPIMGGAGYTKVMVTPTGTGATIAWNTYEPATTQVKYGITSGYGSTSSLNPSLVTSHSVTLTGLLPATLYHYQVISVDAVGNIAALADQTFTTTPYGTKEAAATTSREGRRPSRSVASASSGAAQPPKSWHSTWRAANKSKSAAR
ncbi:MAG: fibronectin type III domain-containing protein [Terriglobales bacterium]